MKIHQMIYNARVRKKMTQMQLAKELGYTSSQFIHLIESGQSKLPLDKIRTISSVLGISKRKIYSILLEEFKISLNQHIN